MDQTIPLSQKLYLLSIHPEKGGIIFSSRSVIQPVLSGAMLLELLLNKNIVINQKKVILQNEKTPFPVHAFILEKIKQKHSPGSISNWISILNSQKYIRKEIQNGLIEKRLIKMQPVKFLFFRWEKPFVINKQAVFHLVNEVENMIFRKSGTEEDLVFLSMLPPSGILKRIFSEREKRKRVENQLKQLAAENQVSEAVSQAIAAAQSVAASVAITAAVAGSHH